MRTGSISLDRLGRVGARSLSGALKVAGLALLALGLAACSDAGGPPTPSADYQLEVVTDGLAFPAGVVHAGDARLFLLELGGTIRILQGGALLETPFLDLRGSVSEGGEGGLLGLAFPPDHATSGRLYVYYTAVDAEAGLISVLSRFQVMPADPNVADPASEERLVTFPQPSVNHNGGQLAFGPDGYLYWALGDGGNGGQPAQGFDTRLGTLLRLDVSGASGYAVPADNPFAGQGSPADEFWAYGLRNPWRFSFDRGTGDLYIADVGESGFEEVNVERAGASGGLNYGWPIMEGDDCHGAAECDATGLTPPTFGYVHGDAWGRSITGGYVYRGRALPALAGAYVFGDFVTGRVWSAREQSGWEPALLFDTEYGITSFGEDVNGELYLVDAVSGTLYRLTK